MSSRPRTLYEKIWDAHVIETRDDGTCLIFIDRHLVHEVTSPQAFEGLRMNGRKVRRPELTLAVPDHNLPTTARIDAEGNRVPIADPESRGQLAALERNAPAFGVRYFGATAQANRASSTSSAPSRASRCPARRSSAATATPPRTAAWARWPSASAPARSSTCWRRRRCCCASRRPWKCVVEGELGPGITSKDLILHIIGTIGTAGGTGHVIEYRGKVFEEMSIESRLTVCNMSIEGGARAGLIAPDETTFAYLKGRPLAPKGEEWDAAVAYWRTLHSDEGAEFDKSVTIDAAEVEPTVTWGTSPEDTVAIGGVVPDPESFADAGKQQAARASLDYMGLKPGQRMDEVEVQNVFIGSCTNSRIEDLRAAAEVLKGRKKAPSVKWAIVVPGSGLVKAQAEAEGLDKVFTEAGLEWREPGCSACLGMNPDKVPAGERCASTSNRNFVGRQGPGARTHLVSPAMAAAAAVTGRLTDVRELA